MKTVKILMAVCLLSATVGYSGELSAGDRKWSEAVEKMIVAGPATISTADENRVKLAQKLAVKHDCQCKVEKTENGYKITVQTADKSEKLQTAKN